MNRPDSDTGRQSVLSTTPARFWRAGAVASCFFGFCALACLAALILLPVALAWPGERARRVRRLASLGFRILLVIVQRLSIGKVHIEGREYLASAAGCLVVANHPCFVDSLVLFALLPEANCIMKDKLRRHPLFFPFVRAGRYISNAAGPLENIEACRRAREAGETIIVFPEGSRTHPGATPVLGRGAAQIALRAGMDILPATIRCTPPILTHGRPWYYMPPGRIDYALSFHAPRPPHALADTEGLRPPIAARRLTSALQNWFEQQLDTLPPMQTDFFPPGTPSDGPLTAQLQAGRVQQ